MMKKTIFFFVGLLIIFTFYSFINPDHTSKKNHVATTEYRQTESKVNRFTIIDKINGNHRNAWQENHPPVVKITSPKNNSVYEWNATVPYTISVSDQEDGESQFDEIPVNEVFLEVRYVPDATKVTTVLRQTAKKDPPGFAAIKTSNCLNCHAFATKLIGPSFYDISKRYPATRANTALLVKHIQEGSTGVWGNVSMPTHPELSKEETQEMVQWILKNGGQPDITYYRGAQGSFRLKPPAASKQKGVFVLTATYTDHGAKDGPKKGLTGQDVIVIKGR